MRCRAVVVAALFLAASCTGGSPTKQQAFHPILRPAPCPEDVEIFFVSAHSCAYLTVLEDRRRPDGPTVRLFTIRVPPPSGESVSPDPVFAFGRLSFDEEYDGGLAEQLHRVVYGMDLRGQGHSKPGLACPEADPLATYGMADPTGDSGFRQRLIDAVRACRRRLVAQGIDPSDFGIEQMAADVEDLRRVLAIPSWSLGAYGGTSRVAFEVMREFPEHIRAVYLDSPQFPQLDDPTEAVVGTQLVLETMFGACGADASCRSAYPDLRGLWSSAIARVDARPVPLRSEDATGNAVPLLVDGGAFVRAIRGMLAGQEDGFDLTKVPAAIAAAARGRVTDEVARTLARGGALCAGYVQLCHGHFSLGQDLSVLCQDQAPFVDSASLTGAAGVLPGLLETYASNPFLAACSMWKVRPGASAVHATANSQIPTLVLTGRFDPWSPPKLTRKLGRSLRNASFLDVPNWGFNPVGDIECATAIRNAWLDEPASPPTMTSCLHGLRVRFATG
jgi:pimeloyl-ACP methyl ester carboxylesterase